MVPGLTACACCGSDRLAKIGKDVTETLEVVPRQWKVIKEDAGPRWLNELEAWMRIEPARLSRHADVAKAFDYMLTRWPASPYFPRDSRICRTNNAAERVLRGSALGRKA